MQLEKKTFLNTRPKHQAAELSSQLQALGARVIELPGVAIQINTEEHLLVELASQVAAADWLLFTSANAVAACAPIFRHLGIQSLPKIGVVGSETAKALACEGIKPTFVSTVSNAARFAKEVSAFIKTSSNGPLPGLLWFCGSTAKPLFQNLLEEGGLKVQRVEVYTSSCPNYSREELQQLEVALLERAMSGVIFTSSISAAHIISVANSILSPALFKHFLQVPAFVIGEPTKATVLSLGWNHAILASESSTEGILHAICRK